MLVGEFIRAIYAGFHLCGSLSAIVVFWITFWADHDGLLPDVLDYESNFIIPDLVWIAGLLLIASYWLKKDDTRGIVASSAAAGGLVFLGLLDIQFNWRHGQYAPSSQGWLNVVVNAGCIWFGLWTLVVMMRDPVREK